MTDATLSPAAVPHDGTDAEARPIFREDRKVLGISTEAWPGILGRKPINGHIGFPHMDIRDSSSFLGASRWAATT